RGLADRLLPHLPLRHVVDAEALELDPRGRFACPPFHAAVADEVERRDALGDSRRGIVVGRHECDPVGEPDAPRTLARRGEENLRRGGVRVLLEEVVLDLPREVDAEAVGELHLGERLLVEPMLVAILPGTGNLVLVEDAESHDVASLDLRGSHVKWSGGRRAPRGTHVSSATASGTARSSEMRYARRAARRCTTTARSRVRDARQERAPRHLGSRTGRGRAPSASRPTDLPRLAKLARQTNTRGSQPRTSPVAN